MSKRYTQHLGALIVVVAALAFPGLPTQAAVVQATASITDLSSSLLSFGNNQYLSDASTPFHEGFDVGDTLQNYLFHHSTPGGNTSFASIDNSLAPFPQTAAGASNSGQGSASVLWTFDWTARETGTASIALEYLSSALLAGLRPGESAFASSFVSIMLDGAPLQQSVLNFFNAVDSSRAEFGTLRLAFDVFSGQTGTFTVTLASNAFASPVPLPATLPLLSSALLALAALRRRRKSGIADVGASGSVAAAG